MTQATSGVVPTLTGGQRLRIAREYTGMNQEELARQLDVTTATVQRAESGKTAPRRTTFMAWSMVTGVDLGWLEHGKTPGGNDPDGGSECAIRDLNPEPADLVLIAA